MRGAAAPIGRSAEGLPGGVQLVGPTVEDHTPLRLAELLEREFDGFTPPPPFRALLEPPGGYLDCGQSAPHHNRRNAMTALTLADARKIIAAAEAKAEEIGQPMNVAVVDAGSNLIAHIRMDGAWIGSVDISINKAWTSRAFDITTKHLGENSQPGQDFYGILASNNGKVMIFAGGIPLTRDGKVVGAIGVSGGTGDQDQTVAEAGAASL
ncbi:hypothetical protein GCM10009608_10200 [Pseudonocardia alaniniphila]